jgi:hypothetical protein
VVYCQAQFQLAIAVAIELSLALLSLLNSPSTHPPVHPPTHPVKVSKHLFTEATAGFGRQPQFFLTEWMTTSIFLVKGR